jgi:hypothetical protein
MHCLPGIDSIVAASPAKVRPGAGFQGKPHDLFPALRSMSVIHRFTIAKQRRPRTSFLQYVQSGDGKEMS